MGEVNYSTLTVVGLVDVYVIDLAISLGRGELGDRFDSRGGQAGGHWGHARRPPPHPSSCAQAGMALDNGRDNGTIYIVTHVHVCISTVSPHK